jgi:hypothetical protein
MAPAANKASLADRLLAIGHDCAQRQALGFTALLNSIRVRFAQLSRNEAKFSASFMRFPA